MGVEACADGCMGEVSLHVAFLLLGLAFYAIKFDSLSLDVCKASVLCSQSVDVGDNPSIAKME
jgi:hypothetical protein